MFFVLLSVVVIPLLALFVDLAAQLRVGKDRPHSRPAAAVESPAPDFTIMVPIYGDVKYLENIDYLDQYGNQVLLATSSTQSAEFYAALHDIADRHGFRVFSDTALPSAAELQQPGKRAVGGTLRDLIVRDAHQVIDTDYVVCIDADTRTVLPLDLLVREFIAKDLDLASIRLEASNNDTVLARLQAHEYAMAMRLRLIMPWMISGACHIARSDVHRTLMNRHSLFFQGNDVELGLMAVELGYRVGHIPFRVPTTVPSHFTGWWRQRRAWAGGEFRLMAVNLRLSAKHPFLYLYGLVIIFGMLPLRWYYLTHPGWSPAMMIAAYYAVITVVNWRTRDRCLLIYPLYALLYSLVLVPLGIYSYARMAIRYRNAGIIRPQGRPSTDPHLHKLAAGRSV